MKNSLIAGLVLTGLLASPVAVEAIAVPGAAEQAKAAPSQSPAVSQTTVFQTNARKPKKPAYICDDGAPTGLDDPGTTDLIAGQHNVVGNVTFALDGDKLKVTYQTFPDLVITEAHLYVGDNPPTKSAPGQFPYHWPGDSGDSPSSTVVFEVDYPGGCQTIAAHSVVEDRSVLISYTGIGLDELPGVLPATVDMCVKKPGDEYLDDSYFDARILNSLDLDLLVDGFYDAYCVNTNYLIGLNESLLPDCDVQYTANVHSSYGVLPAGLIPQPEYLDEVNWLINQDYVGKTSLLHGGVFTWGDLQRAIWDLVSPVPDCAGCNLGSWSPDRAEELLNMALLNGSGFEPTCGERVAIILDPVNADGASQEPIQPIIVWIELPCDPEYGDETAWAGPFSCQFTTGWGWFFNFCPSQQD